MPDNIVDKSQPNETPSGVVVAFSRPAGRSNVTCDDMGERLRELFREHRVRLIRFLQLRLGSEADAQDAAQDAIFRLFQRRDTLRDQELRGLLYVTARNIAIDRLRDRRRSPLRFGDETEVRAALMVDEAACPERTLSAREELASIRVFLDELPAKCAQAFTAYKFEELEYRQIAERMGLTESMVRKYVLRALAHCAARLAERENSER